MKEHTKTTSTPDTLKPSVLEAHEIGALIYRYGAVRFAGAMCKEVFRRVCWSFRKLFQREVTLKTRQGLLTVSTHDGPIATSLYVRGEYEFQASCLFVEYLINRGYVGAAPIKMLDVGANIGLISIGLAQAGFVDWCVAVEPEPSNFGRLVINIDQNNLVEVILPLQFAAGVEEGELELEVSPVNHGDHRVRAGDCQSLPELAGESMRSTVRVPARSLDQMVTSEELRLWGWKDPDLLWIDVQGYEGFVFRGADSLLAQGLPTVTEVWPYGILRAGMTLAEFTEVLQRYWTHYHVLKDTRLIRYPISVLPAFLEELGTDGDFASILLTRRVGD